MGEVLAMRRRSVRVVEVKVKRRGVVQCILKHFRWGHIPEAQLYGSERGGGDGQEKFTFLRAEGADQQNSRASQMGKSEAAECIALLQGRRGEKDRTQQFARSKDVRVISGDKIYHRHFA